MAGNILLRSHIRIYVIENAQSIGESCPIFNFSIAARTGMIKGSVTQKEITYRRLSVGSMKNGRIIRMIIAKDATSRAMATLFAKI